MRCLICLLVGLLIGLYVQKTAHVSLENKTTLHCPDIPKCPELKPVVCEQTIFISCMDSLAKSQEQLSNCQTQSGKQELDLYELRNKQTFQSSDY